MSPDLLRALAFVCPLVFGSAMAILAYWIFDLASIRQIPSEFGKTIKWVLGWMVVNGGSSLGSIFLGAKIEALQEVSGGSFLMALGYLAGFGFGILFSSLKTRSDRSIVGQLQRHLSGQQLEAVLLLYRYGVNDITIAAQRMGVTCDEFARLHLDALRILQKHAKSLVGKLKE